MLFVAGAPARSVDCTSRLERLRRGDLLMMSLLQLVLAGLVVAFGLWMHINHYDVLANGLFLACILYFVGEYVSGRWKMIRMTPEQIYQANRTRTAPALTPTAIRLRWAAAGVALASIAYQCWTVP
jgi:hypothetical protein